LLRFFNHYIALPTLLLATIEAVLFFLLLLLITALSTDYEGLSPWDVPYGVTELVAICAFFLTLLTAIGFYNRDAVFQLGTLLQRSVLFLSIVFVLGFLAWFLDDLMPSLGLSSHISLFAMATVLNFVVILTIRVAFISFPKFDVFKRRVLVLGRGNMGNRIVNFLRNEGATTLHEVGYLDVASLTQSQSQDESGVTFEDLPKFAKKAKADEIVIATREWRGLPVWELLECKMTGVHVTDYLTFWERETGQIDLDEVKPSWLALSDGFRVNRLRKLLKRWFDISVSLSFLFLTLPLMVITALLIKIESPGPIFYRQTRVGLHGRHFEVIKFRSMRSDAEVDGVPKWATDVDPRITRVGQFIRRSRIDEIPQAFNVLLGHMSFVGPRPERPYFVNELEDQLPLYSLRHNVRPGITGWAQVNYPYGASVEDAKQKLAYDLYYVKNGGLFLDLVILTQTVRVVLSGDGAR